MKGEPFEPGNTFGKGRPPGSRNKKTRFLESLENHGEAIIEKTKVLALHGNPTALRLCLERLIPVAKAPATRFRLPKIETPADLKNVLPGVMNGTAKGRGNAFEAEAIAKVVDTHVRTMDAGEFHERILVLEEARPQPQDIKRRRSHEAGTRTATEESGGKVHCRTQTRSHKQNRLGNPEPASRALAVQGI